MWSALGLEPGGAGMAFGCTPQGKRTTQKIIIPTIFCTVKQQRRDFQCVMPIQL